MIWNAKEREKMMKKRAIIVERWEEGAKGG
jgi:hypothetical protein